jgi:hypothetical protein
MAAIADRTAASRGALRSVRASPAALRAAGVPDGAERRPPAPPSAPLAALAPTAMTRSTRRPLRYRGFDVRSEEKRPERHPDWRHEWGWYAVALVILAGTQQMWEHVSLGAAAAVLIGGSLLLRLAKGLSKPSYSSGHSPHAVVRRAGRLCAPWARLLHALSSVDRSRKERAPLRRGKPGKPGRSAVDRLDDLAPCRPPDDRLWHGSCRGFARDRGNEYVFHWLGRDGDRVQRPRLRVAE